MEQRSQELQLGQSVAGTDGGNDGWLVVSAAVIGGGLTFLLRRNRGAGIPALLGGLLGGTVTIYDRSHVSDAIQKGGAFTQALAQIGWGLNLAMIASISLAVAGLVWLFAVPSEEAIDETSGTPETEG
jgi:hypothetical protein